ncbi:MAG: trigger factor [Hyphomicrobiaceae bacterium]
MEIKEINTDGLSRTLEVVVGAGELNERFDTRLGELRNTVQLKGFRKGKVPVTHLKKVYGKQVMAEILEQTVKETSSKAIQDREERAAAQPEIKLTEDQSEIEKVLNGEADLSYSMTFEVLPKIELTDFSKLELERLVVNVEDEAVEEALGQLRERATTYEVEEGRVAQSGDEVEIDFVGKIDGEAFEGGTASGQKVVLGAGSFIPGFEDGLVGAKQGDEPTIEADFPDDYQAANLAGKTAQFEVLVNSVGAPKVPELDEEFAKGMGVESLEKLTEVLKSQIGQEYADAARQKLKRELLDALEKAHDFELPPSLIEREFEGIWEQLNQGLKQSGKTFEDEGKTEEEAREEYQNIAARRVRLGLIIGEIGDAGKIEVTQEELRGALMQQARSYPGQEKMVYEFYEKNPNAIAELRAPIFEDKVVDHILEQAKPSEKSVTKDELFKLLEEASEA